MCRIKAWSLLLLLPMLAACAAEEQDTDTMRADTGSGEEQDSGSDVMDMGNVDQGAADLTTPEDDIVDEADAANDDVIQPPPIGEDLEAGPEHFTCIKSWDRVRRFRIINLLGNTADSLAVANNPDGGVYPPGTLIQLIPNEAMLKRQPGWAPETSDWEFFFLQPNPDGTTEILSRGTTDVANSFGGNCLDCHAKAAPQWDLTCEQDHGCDPLPIGEALINNLQDGDPRCP